MILKNKSEKKINGYICFEISDNNIFRNFYCSILGIAKRWTYVQNKQQC